jgi:PleD family two-component response regulator
MDGQGEWAKSLEEAFAPYPKFINEVTEAIAHALKEFQAQAEELSRGVSTQKAPRVAEQAPERVSRAKKSVLLIDSAEVNRVLLSHALKGLPVTLRYAVSLSDAEKVFEATPSDLVMINLRQWQGTMPSWGQACQWVGIVSGDSEETIEQARQSGLGHFVFRSQSREVLAQTLSQQLWG